jgi:transposase
MLVVFWGVKITPVLSFLPEGTSMNAETFKTMVATPVGKFADTLPKEEKLFIHWDNASSHTAKTVKVAVDKTRMKILPQPPYSPDLAPSDFFLFGYVKNQLKGKKSANTEELYENVKEIIEGITPDTRLRVMRDWIWRLESVISSFGEYY